MAYKELGKVSIQLGKDNQQLHETDIRPIKDTGEAIIKMTKQMRSNTLC